MPDQRNPEVATDLIVSLVLLAIIIATASTGLAFEGNWPKVLRITAAAGCYIAVLLTLHVRSARRNASTHLDFRPFLVAGAAAGIVSGLVRAEFSFGIFAAGVLGAGLLISAVHWTALVRWRAPRRRAMPHVDYL